MYLQRIYSTCSISIGNPPTHSLHTSGQTVTAPLSESTCDWPCHIGGLIDATVLLKPRCSLALSEISICCPQASIKNTEREQVTHWPLSDRQPVSVDTATSVKNQTRLT